jgi:hypothetical protein
VTHRAGTTSVTVLVATADRIRHHGYLMSAVQNRRVGQDEVVAAALDALDRASQRKTAAKR